MRFMRAAAMSVAFLALAVFPLTRTAFAQNGAPVATGNIHGQVADPSGAVIPGAAVVATHHVGPGGR